MTTLGRAIVLQGNALQLPLPDESVDLIVTSPPYFALRSYQDSGEHYDGQIGSEATPQDFLEALWAATAEMVRVLKPSGSIFVNLGDKYAGSGGHNNSGISEKSTLRGNGHVGGGPKIRATRRSAPDRYNQSTQVGPLADMKQGARDGNRRSRPAAVKGVRPKSLMGLPWRYAIGCIDQLGLILRAEIVWSKPNGLPESVTDRVRRSHEQWFHFTKEGRYFSGVDEIREPHAPASIDRYRAPFYDTAYDLATKTGGTRAGVVEANPLGKLPGSVWTVPTEPLKVPAELGIDHFAAFPSEWPRRLILGWSPSGICIECGEGRRPVVDKIKDVYYGEGQFRSGAQQVKDGAATVGWKQDEKWTTTASITGYACACPEPTADMTPAVVLDPFGGTGTVAMVARALGRIGISVDLSSDYCRLALWRVFESNHDLKTIERTEGKVAAKGVADRREKSDAGFMSLFDEEAS